MKYHCLPHTFANPSLSVSHSWFVILRIEELVEKVRICSIKEVIFSLSTTMEGDTTNYYLFKRLKEFQVTVSVIARGIAVGDELEYADEITLASAISSRLPYENSLVN